VLEDNPNTTNPVAPTPAPIIFKANISPFLVSLNIKDYELYKLMVNKTNNLA
jgi:hypothetical protein